jgi:isopentenyl diphosphate isomerase/L-lactate dehydrogenase-like FMN-dependent dehydrogenase
MSALKQALNIDDLRAMAKRRLPRVLFEFIDRGAEDDRAIRTIQSALERLYIVPKVLGDEGARSLETSVFGRKQAMPIAVAPTGAIGIVAYEGEIAAAKAAAKAGVPYTASTLSLSSLEDIAKACDGERWFQIYVWKDTELVDSLIARAKNAGYTSLFVTLDSAGGANREFNTRNNFSMPPKITPKNFLDGVAHPGWATEVFLRTCLTSGMPTLANYPKTRQNNVIGSKAAGTQGATTNPPISAAMFKRLRDQWKGPLIAKGIVRVDDALTAIECGADGIVVSNHGGRMVDNIVPSIEVLPEIVAAVGHKTTVFYDGGVRRGSDIYKAIALGAKCVLLGRVPIWGTAAAGEAGAAHAFNLLKAELTRLMYQTSCVTIADIGPDRVRWSTERPGAN